MENRPENFLGQWETLWRRDGARSPLNGPELIRVMEDTYACRAEHEILDRDGEVTGVPCYRVRSFLSGRKITSSPFNFYPPLLGAPKERAALETLVRKARESGPEWYAEYKSFHRFSEDELAKLKLNVFIPSVVSELKLADSYESQEAGYEKSLRKNLRTTARRAQEAGIEMVLSEDPKDAGRWYDLLVRLYRDKHRMIPQPFGLYERLLKGPREKRLADLYVAKKGSAVLAGIVVIKGASEWEYSWSATDLRYAAHGLNTLLVDHAIRDAVGQKITKLGFGSSSPADEKLRFFKVRWGCSEKMIQYYYWNHPAVQIDLETSYRGLRAIYSKIPVCLLKPLPDFLVRHLA